MIRAHTLRKGRHRLHLMGSWWWCFNGNPVYLDYPEIGLQKVTRSKAEARRWWRALKP